MPGQIPHPEGHRRVNHGGYVMVKKSGHPRADQHGWVCEHLLVVERALGRPVPLGCQVHHVDGVKAANVGGNLVLCPDDGYHRILHLRAAALDACGNANARKCPYCGRHDAVENMVPHAKGRRTPAFAHGECRRARHKQARDARRSAAA